MKKYLVLENGMRFAGEGFGGCGEVIAETVFTTAMTGYIETLTDKSYCGQAVVQTFPLIGNYGINKEDAESERPALSAYIVREYCLHPSNFRAETTIDSYLKENGIPGLCGIDTRALTRVLREHGTMNSIITSDPDSVDIGALRAHRITKPVSIVSTDKEYTVGNPSCKRRIAVIDLGLKTNIIRELISRDCFVAVFPYNTNAKTVLDFRPTGLMLTNGPGNPKDNTEVIKTIKTLAFSGIPTMGICLGHQLLALASGFETEKLKYGHRGENQPVKMTDGRVYISSQNHGYAVVNKSIDNKKAAQLFVNVNDGTNEGIMYKNIPAFTVQFHPEACGGPHDTGFLFDIFIDMTEGKRNAFEC